MLRPEEARRPFTVSELSAEIRRFVRPLTALLVRGEVSGIRRNSRGCYSLDIKDAGSTVRAWIWDREASRMPILPEDGQQYVFRGRVDYWRTGNLIYIIDRLEYDDVGRLRARLETLKRQLEGEGAFAPGRKRPLPFLPRTVGLVTSPTGAVIHDLQETIHDRYPNMEILVYPAQVQGMASPGSIVAALRQCNREGRADVVVVARGGGSFEELYAFNTEPVARAILASRVPVVTALGHTSDRTVADLVSDQECRTPTAAGERVVPRKADLQDQLAERRRRLRREIGHLAAAEQERLEARRRRLLAVVPALLRDREQRLGRARALLLQLSPERQLDQRREALIERRRRLGQAVVEVVRRRRAALVDRDGRERIRRAMILRLRQAGEGIEHRRRRLAALSPESVLARGYSITFDSATGAVLRSATEAELQSTVDVRLSKGRLRARVEERTTDG
ncbi:MAG TPA: exodeoxyribonuclease VII large subunit [Candidatus Dormibacteraeota bacterium]|jgi:exodeoxyribonuclease VII large subunit|nr:exodeoxyribonuclease VII large subunit [Candidatus Dormibacteraeota bacterium]